jgi:hypothetical protein
MVAALLSCGISVRAQVEPCCSRYWSTAGYSMIVDALYKVTTCKNAIICTDEAACKVACLVQSGLCDAKLC